MAKPKRVLIMAGGTGGHVFPGLALARELKANGIAVDWLGTAKGLEAKVIPEASIPLHFISISGVRGKGIKDILLAPIKIIRAVWQSAQIIRKLNPDIVIGMGGFVSGPGGIACKILGRKLIIHEQNAKPGTTNKWLAKWARKVLEGFPNTFANRNNVETVGNPVRPEIISISNPSVRLQGRTQPLRLLVLGGSLGAQAINQMVPEMLAALPAANRPEVFHQTGEKHLLDTQNTYKRLQIEAKVVPFVKEMDKIYSWADMVICRAGALTISELCAAGLGAILIPYPHAIDDHQTANADFMVREGAAILVQQKDLTVKKLGELIQPFLMNVSQCKKMAEAAFSLRKINATEKVLTICEEICS